MDPCAKSFPAGTLERMDELLLDRKLATVRRERIQTARLLAMGWTAPDVAEVVGCGHSTVERHKRRFLADGEAYLLRTQIGGRGNASLSIDDERQLLQGFAKRATTGHSSPPAKSERPSRSASAGPSRSPRPTR